MTDTECHCQRGGGEPGEEGICIARGTVARLAAEVRDGADGVERVHQIVFPTGGQA